jgi:serine/threonine protein kinase
MYFISNSGLDLMKRLLEKDPSKRINATEALNHDFFSKDNMFAEFNRERSSIQKESILLKEEVVAECQSPLMMTKNNARKHPGLLRDDSCLKFKMKENLLTGRTDQNG